MTVKNDILNLKEFNSWVMTLTKLDSDLWAKPTSDGKWSTSEIISHIMNWDSHIISSILPSVRKGKNDNEHKEQIIRFLSKVSSLT